MKQPQLLLRDLFWLVLVVALATGWWREYSLRRANDRMGERAELLKAVLESRGWTVELLPDRFSVSPPPPVKPGPNGLQYEATWEAWLRSRNNAPTVHEHMLMKTAFAAGCEAVLGQQ
jgi:hypothetical protein